MATLDSFKSCTSLSVGDKSYTMYSLLDAEKNGLPDVSRLPFCHEGAAREPAALRGRPHRHQGRHRGGRGLDRQQGQGREGDRLPPGARADAGLHRRAGRRRPCRHARRDEEPRRRPAQDQPARAGRSRHRPLGHRRRVRHAAGLRQERRDRIPAQRRALPVPEMGPDGLQQLLRRAAGHRHLPPGQSRIPVADGVEPQDRGRADRVRLSGHARRHRFAHHDGERARGARLGRRRHRGRGGDARPADLDADPRGRRLQADRPPARGRHRDRSRADGHADAAQEGRRRQVRRVLRHRPRRHDGRRPRHHRQHGAGIRRDLRLLPDRRRGRSSSCASPAGPTTASRSSRLMPRRRGCSGPRTRRTRCSPTRSS